MKYPEIKNRELHRIVSTAIVHKPFTNKLMKGEDAKFLIVRRSLDRKVFPGRWTVPGGGLEIDDYVDTPVSTKDNNWYYALETSLRREVIEEVGLEMGKVDYLLDLAFIRPDGVPVITLSFYSPWKSGEIKLNSENIEYAWVSADEVKKYDLIAGIAEEIEMVDKILKGENPEEIKI